VLDHHYSERVSVETMMACTRAPTVDGCHRELWTGVRE
jgi:hypothetical protein